MKRQFSVFGFQYSVGPVASAVPSAEIHTGESKTKCLPF